ncbi:carboxyl transferase domain-containing protein [Nocardioides albus]|uniref:acetyl-CoA carboxylase n=1 Tax=Nocardioides albus TaxID=1841 RepID=A0A7W5A3G6_9ACTN|nr:carboxyl transferase domain-containing protein [Nocardioides albus]MBB3089002.1 acetyl/propionyl-CoA carboxylase alpha subunit/acetyl-CoA carboxylase carboxyltransferase component [Nocardioides albus]GGU14890.1 pyruvate carboxylase [Nocardioides albus]
MSKILVANRGEIAVRIIRALHELGLEAVAVYPADDAGSLHVRRADESVQLPGTGAAAYLHVEAIVAAAREVGAEALHPGYGFLSENAELARACAKEGIRFIGPSPEVLELFGDKARAREFAVANGVPVTPGTSGGTSLEEMQAFAVEHGGVMIKALAGGGGRGMRAVPEPTAELVADAYERCASEAQSAFGNDDLYVERLLPHARHIEVQIVADGQGGVQHLWERDCSIQRRHQKLIEVAPATALAAGLRERILAAAVTLARSAGYRGIGTFEFLVPADGSEVWFMEANPRLQVEHTVTEEVTGVDLVKTQVAIDSGRSLADLGLTEPPAVRGVAIQSRVNAETLDVSGEPHPGVGTVTGFTPPTGPGVRVDTCAYPGYTVSPRYDSLLAKVIVHADDLSTAVARSTAALAELEVEGVPTNAALLHGLMTQPDFTAGGWDTGYLTARLDDLLDHRLVPRSCAPVAAAGSRRVEVPADATAVRAPMAGVIVAFTAVPGDVVRAGAPMLVLEAMKMEHVVRADHDLRLTQTLVELGDLVDAAAPLMIGEAVDADDTGVTNGHVVEDVDEEDWSPEVAELARRKEWAQQMGGPEKVSRVHAAGRMDVRSRVEAFADAGSFREIGVLTGFATRDEWGEATSVTPANFVAGEVRVDGRKVLVGADDFSVRGGSGDMAVHEKQIFWERYAGEMRLPMVRLLDGQSGGGSVKMAQESGYTYVPVNPAWDSVVDNLSVVPVVAAGLGPTVGLGAARLVMSHLAVLVEGVGQLFTAGPPVVKGGTGEDLTKEELGGAEIHRGTGSVERFARDEAEAFDIVRRFLSYLPSSVYDLPPVVPSSDPTTRRDELLLSAVPRNKRRPYEIEPIMEAVFDSGSVFTYAEYGDGTVTALARLDGHPVGVIAADPMQGATMSVEGALAMTRLVDLCETFHLPLVSLTDQAGMTIGSVAERRATIRHGARAISAVYQTRVPQGEIIMRRVYGVGGAGIINRHRANRSWAWPSGDWGSLPVQGGIEAAFRAQIEAADDPEAEKDRLTTQLTAVTSPFRTAERFGVQDLIDPRDSRELLCDWVHDAYRLLPSLVGRPQFGTRP